MRIVEKKIFLLLIILWTGISVFGQVSIPAVNSAVTQNFDSIGSSATATLPAGWKVDSATATSNYGSATNVTTRSGGTTGTGVLTTSSAGGTYNFANGITASSTERAVGWLPSGTYSAPRNLFVQMQNNTGQTLTDFALSFNYEKYREGTKSAVLNFSYSTDGVSWTLVSAGGNSYAAGLNTTTVFNPPAQTNKTFNLTGLNLANGGLIYFRWEYTEGTEAGGRQAIGIDDFSVTASSGASTTPTIVTSASSLADFGNISVGTTSAEKAYTISGTNLTDNIVITAPPEFLISTTSGGGYSSSITLTPTGGTVPDTDILVVLAPTSAGSKSGTITNVSNGATTKNVTVSGTGVQSFTINGQVTYKGSLALTGLTVIAQQNGTTVASSVTDANGNYLLSLPGGGTYTISVGTAGFAFAPVNQTFPTLSGNQTLNFNATAATLMISEFRFRGPNGTTDDFVELYNASDTAIDISGFALVSSDNPTVPKYVAPGAALSRTTTIPARGHFLVIGPGYSLGSYATGDGGFNADVPDNAGIGLFVSSTNISLNTRVDAVGFSGVNPVFSEGTQLNPAGGFTSNGETSFFRNYTPYPTDTDNNAANFSVVSTDAGVYNGVQTTLGAPGPENRNSPVFKTTDIGAAVFDAGAGISAPPNRVVDPNNTAAAPLGTIASRRAFTNNTGLAITKFRLRVIGVTTVGSPALYNPQAIVKVLNSADINVTKTDNSIVLVKGVTVETPPNQTMGGGLNSSLIVNLAQPVNPGESINVDTIIGVIANGRLVFNTIVETNTSAPQSLNEHLTMGNPSNAVTNVNQPCNYLMEKTQYALSYCRDRGIPNWVSWHLDSTWLGSTPRQNDFRNDTTLPAGWYQVQSTDYSGSGFDRGHHRPSGDTTNTVPDNSATFLMTNMMPQAPDNNQGPWEVLETYCRTLVSQGNELYIIAGGYGTGGSGSNGGTTSTVAGGKVVVPNVTWKVIIVIPAGTNDVSRVTTSTRTIAVIMPNSQGIRNNDWHNYRVSVDQVEALTGYDFFSNVPTAIQNVIEAQVDNLP